MPHIARLFWILLLACLSPLALGERLRLVTDDWAPYVYQHNGQPRGIDYEVTSQVFKRLGVEVEWQFLPWKRCLAMVEQGLADGILDIFQTESRQPYLVYAPEPMSDVEFVLFQARARRHGVAHLEDLAGLTVGTSPGYAYGAAFNDAPYFAREPAPTLEANFGKLMLGRIDLAITDRRVGHYLLHQLGLQQQVEELPLVISRQTQYLGLVRKPGREALALAFAEELQRFKQEPAYAAISNRYTGDIGNILNAVEQQESSTAR
ncbi:TPA: transporter substrate-binding domain-containing protein [Pseudomonas putida]|jgi:polar amino acid transport system substrate-binding protein|uniref:Extracellular solute-binding protein family 3 n=1 Tax=Pseudomonas putida (strain GB-1) TaxID=76869 RepID=B0KM03_PSEPG|nr:MULTISPECIES: transporter substrate-binding domain-containing protein [Pseudomonas]ABZ00913.1 extracellular solute-binding protein family 3 [Pseudomonas putida GB-1]APF01027.1 amino acid ABC transporter substrate-binding protein [Pseudomonas putida]MBP0710475.1 transporter substrate-binding domain-containing protein [Pseudomonas sp. T34]MCE1000411.1 transporter substrate-binding domain-containing protein [Pseudomonas sp. NMI1173_11]MCK2189921.1 transporter substrate-binding domain-containin